MCVKTEAGEILRMKDKSIKLEVDDFKIRRNERFYSRTRAEWTRTVLTQTPGLNQFQSKSPGSAAVGKNAVSFRLARASKLMG